MQVSNWCHCPSFPRYPRRYSGPMIRVLAKVVSGRRSKWVVIGAWVVLLVALAPQGMTLSKVTTDETATAESLPSDSQSHEVSETLQKRFPEGDALLALAVYKRTGGLTAADKAKIAADAAGIRKIEG